MMQVRDRSGKTLVKDAYASIRMELAPDPLGFSLFMPSKKGGEPSLLSQSPRISYLASFDSLRNVLVCSEPHLQVFAASLTCKCLRRRASSSTHLYINVEELNRTHHLGIP